MGRVGCGGGANRALLPRPLRQTLTASWRHYSHAGCRARHLLVKVWREHAARNVARSMDLQKSATHWPQREAIARAVAKLHYEKLEPPLVGDGNRLPTVHCAGNHDGPPNQAHDRTQLRETVEEFQRPLAGPAMTGDGGGKKGAKNGRRGGSVGSDGRDEAERWGLSCFCSLFACHLVIFTCPPSILCFTPSLTVAPPPNPPP